MRRRYKWGLALLVLLGITLFLLRIDATIGIMCLVVELFVVALIAIFFVLNELLKHTIWYKNVFIYTDQMCTNMGYRNYLIRNLDIVNVGSNPARFAFHYENILGENWSTGNQGLDMDFEILKFRHSFLKKGGYVLIPILPFSSVSGYLIDKPEYCGIKYYAKFARTLDPLQASLIPSVRSAFKWIRFPLFCEPKALRYLILDEQADNRLSLPEMRLMKPQLIEDARKMMESWLVEFKMKSIEEPLGNELIEGRNLSIKKMQEIIDFLHERELNPVLVLPPMSKPLQIYFTQDVKQKLIYDFIKLINRPSVRFLDYSNEEKWQNPSLYFNSLYMNLPGRKQFTNQVLTDLGLLN